MSEPNITSTKDLRLDDKTLAFLLTDSLNISISELCRYIESNFSTVDCYDIKKNYIQISNGHNIINILSSYVYDKLTKVDNYDEDYDYKRIISDNIDVFFDIIESGNDSVIIEIAEVE